ncbi:hypothetical protein IBL28_05560 [Sinomicrobium sp. FJxs]|uniref:Uncharacterized protein n=2 Tax=Sinomicrobium weinanense TaxID=2842200 RepID=A0A926JQ58_9FLAO|nr:hypothetical protein [Sinomicrobium weinanense]MBU3123945.1 hypothetical protein [Sinomicrobium weinanense]
MYRNNDFIYEAVSNLEKLINIPIDIESSRGRYDAILSIGDIQFIVEAKASMRTSNQGLVLSQLEELKKSSNRPIVLISDYISKNAANELKNRAFNYIDVAGNTFIKNNDLIIYIEGQKRRVRHKTNQSRAFQEAGIKIIFHLLSNPINLQHSYREIAYCVDVSIGSVSNVMSELEELNYLLRTKEKRVLKNKKDLLERWLVEYSTVLRPRILRNKMKFIDNESSKNWKNIDLTQFNGEILWGGEPGGAILSKNLRPENYTIYSNNELPEIAKSLKLVPDKNGNVEVLNKFWKNSNSEENIVPVLLIYTDLINSGYGRNIEIANQIFDNELQNIK